MAELYRKLTQAWDIDDPTDKKNLHYEPWHPSEWILIILVLFLVGAMLTANFF